MPLYLLSLCYNSRAMLWKSLPVKQDIRFSFLTSKVKRGGRTGVNRKRKQGGKEKYI